MRVLDISKESWKIIEEIKKDIVGLELKLRMIIDSRESDLRWLLFYMRRLDDETRGKLLDELREALSSLENIGRISSKALAKWTRFVAELERDVEEEAKRPARLLEM